MKTKLFKYSWLFIYFYIQMENILLTENGKSITFVCSSPRKRYYISLFLSLHQAASVGFWVDGNQRTL